MPGHILRICEGRRNIYRTARQPRAPFEGHLCVCLCIGDTEYAGLRAVSSTARGWKDFCPSPTLYQHKYLLPPQHSREGTSSPPRLITQSSSGGFSKPLPTEQPLLQSAGDRRPLASLLHDALARGKSFPMQRVATLMQYCSQLLWGWLVWASPSALLLWSSHAPVLTAWIQPPLVQWNGLPNGADLYQGWEELTRRRLQSDLPQTLSAIGNNTVTLTLLITDAFSCSK